MRHCENWVQRYKKTLKHLSHSQFFTTFAQNNITKLLFRKLLLNKKSSYDDNNA